MKQKLMEVRSATITSKGQISIPKELRETSGFKEGKKITILAFKNHIELVPMKKFQKRMATAYASEKSLAKEWLSKDEDQAWKDL